MSEFVGQLLKSTSVRDSSDFDDFMPDLVIGRTAPRGVFDVDTTDVVGKGVVDQGFKLGKGYAVEHRLGVANLKDGFNTAVILAPGAVLIFFDMFNNTGFDRVDFCLPPPCEA